MLQRICASAGTKCEEVIQRIAATRGWGFNSTIHISDWCNADPDGGDSVVASGMIDNHRVLLKVGEDRPEDPETIYLLSAREDGLSDTHRQARVVRIREDADLDEATARVLAVMKGLISLRRIQNASTHHHSDLRPL